MRPGVIAVAIVLAALAAGGCQRKRAPRRDAGTAEGTAPVGPRMRTLPPVGPRTGPDVFPPEPPAVMPRELDVKLLDPGKGARTLLRYRGGGEARELVARSLVTSHSYADGEWTDEVTQAPVRDGFGISSEVIPASGRGGARLIVHLRGLEGAVEDAGATAAAIAAAEGYLARWQKVLARRRADVTIDARGRLDGAGFLDDPADVQTDARDELVQRWLGLVVPLPEEPIAPGARWRVRTLLRSGGIVLKQTAIYTLVSAGADGWTVKVESERIGEPQDIRIPGVNATLGELIALRRVVTGTLTVGPTDPLPRSGSLSAEVSTHARLRLGKGVTSERYADDRATVALGPP